MWPHWLWQTGLPRRCEQRVPLWDEMEQCFASPEIQQRVRDLQEESAIELSNQSKERALVGEVLSTVTLADQISREFNVSDQGIDLEIEPERRNGGTTKNAKHTKKRQAVAGRFPPSVASPPAVLFRGTSECDSAQRTAWQESWPTRLADAYVASASTVFMFVPS